MNLTYLLGSDSLLLLALSMERRLVLADLGTDFSLTKDPFASSPSINTVTYINRQIISTKEFETLKKLPSL